MKLNQTKPSPLIIDSSIWTNENKLKRVFSWLTRLGVAPKFGSICIQYYQQDQCKAIETLEALAKLKQIDLNGTPIRCLNGTFSAKVDHKWIKFAQIVCLQIVVI